MEDLRFWLESHEYLGVALAGDSGDIGGSSRSAGEFSPRTYASRFPELIISSRDPERDQTKLAGFTLKGAGLSHLVRSGYRPFDRPFEAFARKQLAASFS